ncbi:ClpXP protease specificity-enhancing factor [Coxiella endosymbiont of Amblyomma americanum]|uniref:ClpXP protease specificity-enhancing factor n=1 Tax=Coxiella endosymbiont of Amblyomma americanum TaxID=325775 RepID=UPI00057EAD22|nr:ClpXP protease specificity-enhancing factor [Coxiella endosymbiont of Amblyomma americanum]AJC50203.1 peptidase [Coxiella endosymbiont of Amblyomma americanum]AUJ58564.1 ClpXP protease specificity-enhancing factor [Coxiella-like endosymbiont of Amblyomma americanum]
MTISSRPYLLRAIYAWLTDSQLTPYIIVNAMHPEVKVPKRFVTQDGKTILNIGPQAVNRLHMGNKVVEFDTRFSGIIYHVFFPVLSVMAIYAFENGCGMLFHEETSDDDDRSSCYNRDDEDNKDLLLSESVLPEKKERPNLKIVK